MNAYGTALDNTGTTMVLSPNSEFFRFFRDPDGEAPAKPARRPHAGDGTRRAGGTARPPASSGRCRIFSPPWALSL